LGQQLKKKICILIALSFLFGCEPDNVPTPLHSFLGDFAENLDLTGNSFVSESNQDEIIDSTIHNAPGRVDIRLPNYVYFQGIVHAKNNFVMAGQVRVVGGVLGVENGVAALYSGAMVTANPGAFQDAADLLAGGPSGISTRVRKWEEVPNP